MVKMCPLWVLHTRTREKIAKNFATVLALAYQTDV
jgi:hypothetical protein